MISPRRLLGFSLRHLYPLRRDLDLLSDMIYWPMVDTLLWGVTSQWIIQTSGITNLVAIMLSSLILWNIIWRSQAEVSRNLIDEIWNNNLVNLFSTPFSVHEWVVGVLLLSFIKTAFTMTMLIPATFLLYAVNIFTLGWWLPVFVLCAIMTGWWIGFISAGIVLRFGPKVQTVVWTLPGVMIPFSAIYFPLAQLPAWVQPISRAIPSTYIFESMRALHSGGNVDLNYIALSIGLNVLYLSLALIFFAKSFVQSRKLGLGRFN